MTPLNAYVASVAPVDLRRKGEDRGRGASEGSGGGNGVSSGGSGAGSEMLSSAPRRSATKRDEALDRARAETIRHVLHELKPALNLANALDAGCGAGFSAQAIHHCGLYVRGFDASLQNIVEARERFPRIPFGQGAVEDPGIVNLGTCDLVLCFGLLHRLENPMLAIRHLRALTGKALLLESMCMPGAEPGMILRTEVARADGCEEDEDGLGADKAGRSGEDIALYPSESCLVKMLYRAGFVGVYRLAEMPDHDDFRETPERARRRTALFASTAPVPAGVRCVESLAEPHDRRDPWVRVRPTGAAPLTALPRRLQRFLHKPARTQYISLAQHARTVFPEMPIPLRLPFGAWWLAGRGALDHELIYNGFEGLETGFVGRLLQPGMTVLDIGAHHGLYTLLASKRVGPRGRVIAFEPSPRERRRLLQHLRINRCTNVFVEPLALGDRAGEADLFLVEGIQDWCNSLRPPEIAERTCTVRVEVRPLDDVLRAFGISRVDFIKLDVEGAELSFLRGARGLLESASRPAILAEVQDIRTRPWGYPAREIIRFLDSANYRWFALGENGELLPASSDLPSYDANLVALPRERHEEFRAMAGEANAG